MRDLSTLERRHALAYARARADILLLTKCVVATAASITLAALLSGTPHMIALVIAVTVASVSLVLSALPTKRLLFVLTKRRFGEYQDIKDPEFVPYVRLTENQFDYSDEPDDPASVKRDGWEIAVGLAFLAAITLSIRDDMPKSAMVMAQVMGSSLLVMVMRATHHLFTKALPSRRRYRSGSLPDEA